MQNQQQVNYDLLAVFPDESKADTASEKLKKAGFLTRDPRKHERKKYGQKGARKRFQFSKR